MLLLMTGLAWAADHPPADGHGDESSPEQFVVLLLLLVGMAYLVSHFVVDWLQRRLLFVSGFEYVILGMGLSFLPIFSDLTPLAPILALAAGWVGLVYGMELDLRKLLNISDGSGRLAFFEGIGSGVLVALVAHWFFSTRVSGVSPEHAWLAAGVMGCAGAAGSSSAIDLVVDRYKLDSPLVELLRRAANLGDLASIFIFGVLFCIFHEGGVLVASEPNWAEWTLLTVAIGLLLGLLFSVFLGEDESSHSRFLALVGIIAFAGGAAFMLNLSLLAVNLLLGVVVGNSLPDRSGVAETLHGTRRPMSLVLLFFAGALWAPPWDTHVDFSFWLVWPSIAVTGAYISMRMGGKLVGCWVGAVGTPLRKDLARGLFAQGDEALAMALSLKLVYDGPAIELAYTAILGSVMVHELLAPRILKGLLVDAGEITRERTDDDPTAAPPVAVEA